MKSPIVYYGGKGLMTRQILSYFPPSYSVYVEAFGGAANLLFAKQPTPAEIYNDLGENVYALFKVISDSKLYVEFKARLDSHYYMEQLREEYKEKLARNLSLIDRAVYFFYVNRTSFNSVGGFSISYKFIRRGLTKNVADFLNAIDGLPEVHERLSRVTITHQNAFDLIPRFALDKSAFLYLDPPYVQETRKSNTRYECELTDVEHAALIDLCLESKAQIMLSGYGSSIYKRLEPRFKKIEIVDPVNKDAREYLWINYDVTPSKKLLTLF